MSINIGKLSNRYHYPLDERGSTMVVCLLIVVVLTTVGVLALQTSVTETKITANEQRWQEDFQISEGATIVEAGKVGFAGPGFWQWYEIANPDLINKFLLPPNDTSYDPGDDITVGSSFPDDFEALPTAQQVADHRYWPHENILQDSADNEFDYAYLVTFLGASNSPGVKGYDAGSNTIYEFRINSRRTVDIELGGIKLGPKS